MNIVFVCEGNICRSPMAEALLKETLAGRGASRIQVSSCGLRANPWTSAEPKLGLVIGSAYKHLKEFRSRPVSSEIITTADLVLTMEQRQAREILARFPDMRGRVTTVTGFAGEDGEIRDYLDGEEGDFMEWLKSCHSMISRSIAKIAAKVSNPDYSN